MAQLIGINDATAVNGWARDGIPEIFDSVYVPITTGDEVSVYVTIGED